MEKNVDENLNTVSEAEPVKKSGSAGIKWRKIFNIVLDVILYLFLALCVFLLIISLTSKKNDGAANIFGHEMRIVTSSSMEKGEKSPDVSDYKIKHIKIRSMVFIERVPENEEKAKNWYAELKVGDVLTFYYRSYSLYEPITHRITNITATETGYIIELKGDNRNEGGDVSTQVIYTSDKDFPSTDENLNYVIGKVTGQSVALGNIIYAISQPVGLACIVIVPCAIIIIWQIARVIIVFSEDKKKKQASEVEELKRKIAELESGKNDGDDGGVR